MSQLIKFEKVVPEGKAMGRLKDGRAVFCIGPLPNELAEVGIRKQKKTYAEAVLRKIIEPSVKRSGTAEDHALSCSPWQDVDYAYQLELKRSMIKEAFRQQHADIPEFEVVGAPETLGYRNRLDFTVASIEGQLRLAFHERGSWDRLTPLPQGCRLGSGEMNAAALNLVDQLNQLNIPVEPAMITVRHARTTGELLTILTTPAKFDWSHIDTEKLDHFIVCRPLNSGAPGEIVFKAKSDTVTERLAGTVVGYSYNSFFQTNTAAFEQALLQIIAAASPAKQIVELYSGVGAIGLPLAAGGKRVHGIEIIPEAVDSANRNAELNHISTYKATAVAAEKMDSEILSGADTVILDPPRAGLHQRVTGWLLEAAPERIIYLSCNPVTQARDIALLEERYRLTSLSGFDFYPGTLHVEALALLEKR